MGGSLPAWDTFVLALPFLGVLVMAMFGLDERLGSPKLTTKRSRNFCEVDAKGGAMLSDPDGTLWQAGPIRPIEA
jgi:hypothetical protein